MNKILQRILLFLYLIINVLFVEKYVSRITDYHIVISVIYVIITLLIVGFFSKWILISTHTKKWEIALAIVFLYLGLRIQYTLDPYLIQVDRWSAIHNFLATMMQGEYPYGASTHLGGYGSPFPVWQMFHLPFYAMGNVGLSIFVVTISFVVTIHYFHSSKVALMTMVLLGISPAFWYEIAVRSDLITNILFVATITEWLSNKQIKLLQNPCSLGILSGLILSTRLVAIIPLCVIYGYEFLHIQWKKRILFLLTTIITFITTFIPFLLWNGSTLLFFEYNPFVLQTRQGSWLVLAVFAVIAISITLYMKGNDKYVSAITGLFLTALVTMAFVEKMWREQLWGGLFSSTFDITYLSIALPFYIIHLSRSILQERQI